MHCRLFALLCLAGLVAVGCTPPAQQSSARPPQRPSSQEQPSSSRERTNSIRANENSRAPRARPRTGTPGAFDFYLLTLSWSPEFCATHSSAAECAAHPGFVLHGLWPQNTDATYPENCSNAPGPAKPTQYSDIFPDAGLLEHEWTTHGTCSGLSPDAYFQLARRAYQSVHTPAALNSLTQPTSESPDTILTQFSTINPTVPRTSLALSCGNNYLTAVQVCLSKDLTATSCDVRTCRANVVRIVPRGAN